MCLTNVEKITPQEDIVCYKLFKIDPTVRDSDMWSPFYSKSWKIGKMETMPTAQTVITFTMLHTEKR